MLIHSSLASKINIDDIIGDYISKIISNYVLNNSGKFLLNDDTPLVIQKESDLEQIKNEVLSIVISSLSEDMYEYLSIFYDKEYIRSHLDELVKYQVAELYSENMIKK